MSMYIRGGAFPVGQTAVLHICFWCRVLWHAAGGVGDAENSACAGPNSLT